MNGINDVIRSRYANESIDNCFLSCGNNLRYLRLKKGERVLDLGCGRGDETIEVALLLGEVGEAIGLDLTPEMIEIAEQNALEQGITNVSFVNASVEELPFEDNEFDAVISNCVINHAADKNKVYHEIFRVLKTGGRFVVSDAVCKEALPEHIKNDPDQWAACFAGAITEEEYLQSIQTAGFNDIQIVNRREYLKNGYDFASLTIQATKQILNPKIEY